MSQQPSIGFIGVGSMGWPMAGHLLKAGYALSIYDADSQRAAQFAKEARQQARLELVEQRQAIFAQAQATVEEAREQAA